MKKIEISNNTSYDILEDISKIIHNNWMSWAKELIENEPNISDARRKRWQKECFVDYEDLSEEMKELDRNFARQILNKFIK